MNSINGKNDQYQTHRRSTQGSETTTKPMDVSDSQDLTENIPENPDTENNEDYISSEIAASQQSHLIEKQD